MPDVVAEVKTETAPGVDSDEAQHPPPLIAAETPHSAKATRKGVPIISAAAGTDHFNPSDVRQSKKFMKKGVKVEKKSVLLEKAPTARNSAFSGPPRIDIEITVRVNPGLGHFSIGICRSLMI